MAIEIGGELTPTTVAGILGDAGTIIDRTNGNRRQGEINTETIERIGDKAYVADSGNGMGRIVLKKSQNFGYQLTQTNTTYIIQDDFKLEDITDYSTEITSSTSVVINGITYYYAVATSVTNGQRITVMTDGCVLLNSTMTEVIGTSFLNTGATAFVYIATATHPTGTLAVTYQMITPNATVNIPDNCILKFEGGSLSSGTLASNFLTIDTVGGKIFDDIKFSGGCRYNNIAKADWFISQYPANLRDTTVDNTVELRNAINCGMLTVAIPPKNIRITQTIALDKAINLIEEPDKAPQITPPKQVCDTHIYSNTKPAIFSDQIVTLLSYNVEKFDPSSDGEEQLTIGKINLVTTKTYTDLTNKEVPILDIKTNGCSLWGVQLHCDLYVKLNTITIDGSSKQYGNYTGIRLTSYNGYITYVTIDGNIYNTYLATKCINGGGSNWFTGVQFDAKTASMLGLDATNIEAVSVGGTHQAQRCPAAYRDAGYFTGKNIYLYGYVFDAVSGGMTVYKSVNDDGYMINRFSRICDLANVGKTISSYYNIITPVQYNYVKGFNFEKPNLLNMFLHGTSALRTQFESFSYTLDNVSVLSHPRVFNSQCLFNDNFLGVSDRVSVRGTNVCFFENAEDSGSHTINLSIEFKKSNALCSNYQNEEYKVNGCVLYFSMPRTVAGTEYTLTVSYYDTSAGSYVEYCTVTDAPSYYGNGKLLDLSRFAADQVKIQLSYAFSGPFCMFPIIYIPYYGPMTSELTFETSTRPRLFPGGTNMNIGEKIFDETLSKPLWYNAAKWVEADGATAGVARSGTYAQKPASANIYVGYAYFCTDKQTTEGATDGIMIYHKGSDVWVDALGRTVS